MAASTANAPSWLDSGHAPGAAQQGLPSGGGGNGGGQGIGHAASHAASQAGHSISQNLNHLRDNAPRFAKYVVPIVRVINMGLAVMMAAAAVNGIMKIKEFRLDSFFVALYMFIFAAILFMYELSQWKYIACIDRIFRRNFGFLYGSKGKSLYIIFIAFLNFGLISTGKLQLAAGILLAIDGGLMLFISLKYPNLFAGNAPPDGEAAEKGPGGV